MAHKDSYDSVKLPAQDNTELQTLPNLQINVQCERPLEVPERRAPVNVISGGRRAPVDVREPRVPVEGDVCGSLKWDYNSGDDHMFHSLPEDASRPQDYYTITKLQQR